jgi:hypothetical protein
MLPKTRSDTRTRQSILDFIRSFLSSIDAVRELKVTMKKRMIDIEHENYELFFDSEGEFTMGIGMEKEENLGILNTIMNDICGRLNAKNWKEEKSKIRVYSFLQYKTEAKFDIFSKLVRNEALKALSEPTQVFEPRRIIVSSKNKDSPVSISITVKKKENIVETSLVDMYKDEFPLDVIVKTYERLKEWQNRVSVKLISEGNGTP